MAQYIEAAIGLCIIILSIWFTILFCFRVTMKTKEGKTILQSIKEMLGGDHEDKK